jgi:AraC-like DNA-binding protein/mannose-6-phosphate isomerase-like protein (cupin superfamily)
MLQIDKKLSETDIRTEGSTHLTLRSSPEDQRDWLRNAIVCNTLNRQNVLHLGYATMKPPFAIVRMHLGGSYFLAGLEGKGRFITDGRWKTCSPGQAFLLPAGTMHAFESLPDNDWSFCWVRFREGARNQPVGEANSPVLAPFNSQAFQKAILGLVAEATLSERQEMELLWLDIIYKYIREFAEPGFLDARLLKLFHQVEQALDEAWSNEKMAQVAGIGERQLERLCLKQLGRTPRQHLIWLRMHKAANLLTNGELKIESIAAEVGYTNPFAFSNTFKRYMGWAPSKYPGREPVRM